jgi:hypothetical protein
MNWLGVPRVAFSQHRDRLGSDGFYKIRVTLNIGGQLRQQSVRPINHLVQFVNGVSVIAALKR